MDAITTVTKVIAMLNEADVLLLGESCKGELKANEIDRLFEVHGLLAEALHEAGMLSIDIKFRRYVKEEA